MDVRETTEALAERMAKQLRVRGDGLSEVTAKAGRKLPKYLRAEAEALIQAEEMAQNPKLARLIDPKRVKASERKMLKYLNKQNPKAERMGEFLDVVAKIAFVIFVVMLVLFITLLNRGYFD